MLDIKLKDTELHFSEFAYQLLNKPLFNNYVIFIIWNGEKYYNKF